MITFNKKDVKFKVTLCRNFKEDLKLLILIINAHKLSEQRVSGKYCHTDDDDDDTAETFPVSDTIEQPLGMGWKWEWGWKWGWVWSGVQK